MTINIKAILTATLLSYVLGSLWYMAIGKWWRMAVGWPDEGVAYCPTGLELAVALIGQLTMAVALSGLLFHMGRGTLQAGLLPGFLSGSVSSCRRWRPTLFFSAATGR